MAAYTTVDDGTSFFNPLTYTGTGSSLALTGVGFQPDLTWIKNRDAADFHVLTDAVRGATEYLQTNDSGATTINAESLKSFDSDGFTVGTMAEVNTNTEDYVSWNWKLGTTSGLSGGTLTPDAYSYNATAGQGVYEYTGGGSVVTIAHGLGAVPKFMLGKRSEDNAQEWRVYHVYNGPTKFMVFDQNDAVGTNTLNWNDTAPDSTVFTLGTSLTESGKVMMNYVFADVQGYSKFSSYIGNGNVDGPFIYTGFRPAFIIVKRTDSTANWVLFSSPPTTQNQVSTVALFPNNTDAESTYDEVDFLSNGIKIRDASGTYNTSTATYLYAAFAQSPFVNSNGIPTNAQQAG